MERAPCSWERRLIATRFNAACVINALINLYGELRAGARSLPIRLIMNQRSYRRRRVK